MNPVSSFRTALRFLKRDWKSGELNALTLAVIIAVGAVTAVSFFTNRLENALAQQANELLGADLVIQSDHVLGVRYTEKAKDHGLQVSRLQRFPSMVQSASGNQLATVRVIDDNYPLRGTVYVSSDLFAPDSAAEGVPQPGRIWMEPRVFTALGIAPGEQVLLGEISLVAEKVLASLPGRGGDLFGVAPVVLVNEKDLNATGLIGPGSRIQVSLLLAGKDSDLQNYKSEVSPSLEAGASFQDIREARPEIRVALERAGMFLGLAALTSVILAGVAVAMAARRFAIRHLDHAAIMRCLGATQSFITRVFGFQLLFLGLAASLVGSALGFAAHFLLLEIVTGLLGVVLPAADYKPLLAAILTGSITLIGFALPPILHLKRVPALRVLRRDIGNISTPGRLAYLFGVAALSGLVLWQADDIKLGVYVVLGFLIAIALLALCAWCLLALIRKLRLRGGGWRFGLLHLVRHGRATMIQTVAFGLGIMSLLLLAVIRGDLLDEWQGSLPADAPNRFIVNVQPNQVAPMQEFFTQANVKPPELFPIVRARMVEINGVPVEKQLDDEQVRRQVDRPLNVSWVETLMSDNQILEGKWWDEIEDPSMNLVSIEEGVAKNLKLKLGDMLKFNVAGEHFEVKVASIRKVDWDSFRANFFVLARPGFLNEYPTTYMTGFYLGTENYKLLGDLVKQFPSITVLDVAAIMGHVRDIIHRVSSAVEYVFLFTLAAGLVVLYAGIQSTQDERLLENAIVRTLGGQRNQILQTLLSEFVLLGLMAGLIASVFSGVLAYVVSEKVLRMSYTIDPALVIWGISMGALGVGLAGLWGTRSVLSQPPLSVFRRISA